MKFKFLTLLLFYPISSVAMMDIDDPSTTGLRGMPIVSVSNPAYFKSPDRISCQCPSFVVFHQEDKSPSLEKGNYGEKQLKRTFLKFAAINKNMDLYKNNDKSDKGYDLVLVDHGQKLVIFLDAKSSDLSTILGKKPSKKRQKECEDLLLNPETQLSRELIKTQLQNHLGKKDVDQLSRKWCYKCSSKTVKLEASFRIDPAENTSFDLKDLIEKSNISLCALLLSL